MTEDPSGKIVRSVVFKHTDGTEQEIVLDNDKTHALIVVATGDIQKGPQPEDVADIVRFGRPEILGAVLYRFFAENIDIAQGMARSAELERSRRPLVIVPGRGPETTH